MCQKAECTTADVLIGFQKRPGIEDSGIISDVEALLVDTNQKVKPQGKGYYGLKIKSGETARLKIFDSIYKVRYQEDVKEETGADKGLTVTAWKEVGGDLTRLIHYQRGLQLLGYYPGKVDNKNGRKTEHSVLCFQADNKLLTDADVGPRTSKKLKEVIDNKNKADTGSGGKVYINRRHLLRFTRGPLHDKPEIFKGWPRNKAPDVDDRGFIKTDSLKGEKAHGPVVTVRRYDEFRVRLVRDNLAPEAKLVATSSDDTLVKILTPSLPGKKHMILKMKAGKPDKGHKSATVSIKWKSGDSEIELAALQVLVVSRITRLVRPYWVTLDGVSPGTAADKNKIKAVFNTVGTIWRQHGVNFYFQGWRDAAVNGMNTAGQITWASVRGDFTTMVNGCGTAARPLEADKLNIFFVKSITGAYGFCYDPYTFRSPIGIAFRNDGRHWTDMGRDLAHELGHYLGLALLRANPRLMHVDNDPNPGTKKNDLWTLRKVMFSGFPPGGRADFWAKDPGYGSGKVGAFITVRNLPRERTDNECHRSRKAMLSSKFYKSRLDP